MELADNSYTPAVVLQQAKINLAKLETQLEQVKQLLALDIRTKLFGNGKRRS